MSDIARPSYERGATLSSDAPAYERVLPALVALTGTLCITGLGAWILS